MRKFSLVVRVATVLLLALAALLLAIDAPEYPGRSRAGLRALAQGALPLLLVAGLNLHALDAGRGWRWCAGGVNLLVLGVALGRVHRGAPLFFWMLAGVGAMLVVGSAGLLRAGAARMPSNER